MIDTHTLIWYLTKDRKLSPSASAIFAAAERGETQLVISAIVMAELFYASAKWRLFPDFAAMFADLQDKPYFQFASFTPQDVLGFATDRIVPEMHDRIITGLARRLGVPIITSDPAIIASGLVEIA